MEAVYLMSFEFSGEGAIIGFPGYAVALVIAIAIAKDSIKFNLPEDATQRRRKFQFAGVFTAWFLTLSLIGNFFVYMGSLAYTTPTVGTNDVLAELGLEPGKAYPLRLGSRLGGSSIDVEGRGRYFSVRSQPGSALSVDFRNGSQGVILELPVSGLTFPIEENTLPQVQMYFKPNNFSGQARFDAVPGDCEVTIKTLVVMCDRPITYKLVLYDQLRRDGLAPLVRDTFQSASLTVSQEMYNAILGKNG